MEPEDLFRARKGPPPVPVQSQMHPVHIFPPYFPEIRTNIILISTLRPSEGLFPSGFPT
jgi:hypothetical protein